MTNQSKQPNPPDLTEEQYIVEKLAGRLKKHYYADDGSEIEGEMLSSLLSAINRYPTARINQPVLETYKQWKARKEHNYEQ